MHKISKELAEKILNYLATRPYIEVYKLIPELQHLEPVDNEISDSTKDKV